MKTKRVPLVITQEHIFDAIPSRVDACVLANAIRNQFDTPAMVRCFDVVWPNGDITQLSERLITARRDFDNERGFQPGIYPIEVPTEYASK